MLYIVGSINARASALGICKRKKQKIAQKTGFEDRALMGLFCGGLHYDGWTAWDFFFFAEYRSGGKKCFNATVSCVIGDKELCQLEDAE